MAHPSKNGQFSVGVNSPKNNTSYLEDFLEGDRTGQVNKGWHWPAFFVTGYWLPYRKMWLYWLLYLFVAPIGAALAGFVFGMLGAMAKLSEESLQVVTTVVILGSIFVLPAIYARPLLFSRYKKLIDESRLRFNTHNQRLAFLRSKGGTSRAAWILLLIFAFIMVTGILAAIAIPAYQDYTNRAKISELLLQGSALGGKIQETYNATGLYNPQKFETINSRHGRGRATQNGQIHFTLDASMGRLSGKEFVLSPVLDNGKITRWDCANLNVPVQFLPHQCRSQGKLW